MIISCPACQTQFNVDPGKLAPAGRTVRCAKCGHVWKVGPDGLPIAEMPEQPEATVQETPETVPGEPGEAAAAEPGDGDAAEPEAPAGPEAGQRETETAAGNGGDGKSVLLADGGKPSGGDKPATAGDAEKAALANLAEKQKALRDQRQPGRRKRVLLVLLVLLVILAGAFYVLKSKGFLTAYLPGGSRVPAEVGIVTSEEPKPVEGGHILDKGQ